MKINKYIFIFLILCSSLFAHKIPGIKLEVKDLKDNTILVNAKYKKSQRALVGNKVLLKSMIDYRVLYKGKLPKGGLKIKIPNESYWVYLIVRDNDVVLEGPAPKEGFEIEVKKEAKAFLYTSTASFIFLFLSIILMFKNKRQK